MGIMSGFPVLKPSSPSRALQAHSSPWPTPRPSSGPCRQEYELFLKSSWSMILSTLHRTDALRVASAVRCFGASNHDHNYDDTNGSEKAAEVTVQGSNQTMPCIIIDDGLESQMLISRERFLIGYIAMHEVSWLNWAPGHNTYHKQAIKAAGSWYEPDLRE